MVQGPGNKISLPLLLIDRDKSKEYSNRDSKVIRDKLM